MEQKKRIVVFKVNEINGYELKVQRSETYYGMVMETKTFNLHYYDLVKELQNIVSQKDALAIVEGIEGVEELINLIKERRNLIRKIDEVALKLLTNAEDE